MEDPEELTELQQVHIVIRELREGLMNTMSQLSEIQFNDKSMKEEMEDKGTELDKTLNEIHMQLTKLNSQLSSLQNRLDLNTESQRTFKDQLHGVQQQQIFLVDELVGRGVLSDNYRRRLHVSGDDSHSPYSAQPLSANHGASDQDSGVNVASHNTPSFRHVDNFDMNIDEVDDGNESDSSAVNIANKSLHLSRSLGDNKIDLSDVDDAETENIDHSELGATRNVNDTSVRQLDDFNGLSSASELAKSPRRAQSSEGVRRMIVTELVDTEKSYCTCLLTIMERFSDSLRQSGLVPASDLRLMFPASIEHLYLLHSRLSQKLQYRLLHWRVQGAVGDIFTMLLDDRKSDLMEVYRQYVRAYPTSVLTMRRWCEQSKRFRKLLKKCTQTSSLPALDLNAFLITPIQRLPRYILLLKRLVKHTPPEHPDHYFLDVVLTKLADFLSELNTSIAKSAEIVDSATKDHSHSFLSHAESTVSTSSLGSMDSFRLPGLTKPNPSDQTGVDGLFSLGQPLKSVELRSLQPPRPTTTSRNDGNKLARHRERLSKLTGITNIREQRPASEVITSTSHLNGATLPRRTAGLQYNSNKTMTLSNQDQPDMTGPSYSMIHSTSTPVRMPEVKHRKIANENKYTSLAVNYDLKKRDAQSTTTQKPLKEVNHQPPPQPSTPFSASPASVPYIDTTPDSLPNYYTPSSANRQARTRRSQMLFDDESQKNNSSYIANSRVSMPDGLFQENVRSQQHVCTDYHQKKASSTNVRQGSPSYIKQSSALHSYDDVTATSAVDSVLRRDAWEHSGGPNTRARVTESRNRNPVGAAIRKSSFRESVKSFFLKKRKSRVLEMDATSSNLMDERTILSKRVVTSNRMTPQPVAHLGVWNDRYDDPCSAV